MQSLAPRKVFQVSDLTREIKTVLEISFDEVWVVGEISNFKRHSSGHIYLTLKDEGASLSAAFFRQSNRFLAFQPQDGDAVLVHGRITLYEPRGSYQILIDRMEPAGEGARKAQIEALKARLAAEGLFDPGRKRPLPAFPRCIGIATSPTGAVIRDILTVTRRRYPNLHILIAPCRVQGEGAGADIVRAIGALNRDGRPDVIIVGRGGGSMEDLWAFNEELVCRAIARSKIPVVSAVGHETDTTLADMVADLRAPTPSAAAEVCVQNQADLLVNLTESTHRLSWAMRRLIQTYLQHVGIYTERIRDPRVKLHEQAQRVDELTVRIEGALLRNLEQHRKALGNLGLRMREQSPRKNVQLRRYALQRIGGALAAAMTLRKTEMRSRFEREAGRLHALSPLGVLGRGYAIAFTADNKVIDDPAAVGVGDPVQIKVKKGRIQARVEKTWLE